jgi:MoaA/NifB/PqqE/SkfB family radical SAM enzyme
MNTPKKIRLEVSSICQLKCPSCPTTTKAIHPTVGSGFLKLTDFQKLLNENPWIRVIELSNYGEIFLNPELSEIMREAFLRRIRLTADNGVNLNHVNERVLEDLVRYRFHSMTCSIDGATSKSYQVYRVKGNFEAVIRNIEKINQLKKKYRSQYPLLAWQFIVFGHNEHEIPLARKLARQFNMTFRPKLTWDMDFSPIRDRDYVKRQLGSGAATRQEFRELHGVDYRQDICHQLWDQPQINWDGKILGCCRNFWGDFGGNALTDRMDSCAV